jgi:hypothetical protein
MKMACLEHGGTTSVAGKERGRWLVRGERPTGLCSFIL